MRTHDFDFELPDELIAQEAVPRGLSRLLVLDRERRIHHGSIRDLPRWLEPGDVLLRNDTRVIAARLKARRETGRVFELLLLDREDDARWAALLRPSARAHSGERLRLPDGGDVVPKEAVGEGIWRVEFDPAMSFDRLEEVGETPLPPYIQRPEGPSAHDRHRYQTVYASAPGAVAAPTAGLHFDDELFAEIRSHGVEIASLTLHVGIGTFRPVSVDDISEHTMHAERYCFSEESAELVNRALAESRRIVCLGTTSVRALEGNLAAGNRTVQPGWRETDIFITPGFAFKGTGAMVTNFHLPKSTLLMMVSAFAGRREMLTTYEEAVRMRYRFFSYGDAMLIL